VAFGPDTNFGDHAGWHVTFSHVFADDEQSAPPHERVPLVDGIENPADQFPNIVRWLVAHFPLADIAAERVIGIYRELADRFNDADTLVNLGDLWSRAGDSEAALRRWADALAIFDEMATPTATRSAPSWMALSLPARPHGVLASAPVQLRAGTPRARWRSRPMA